MITNCYIYYVKKTTRLKIKNKILSLIIAIRDTSITNIRLFIFPSKVDKGIKKNIPLQYTLKY